MTKKRKGHSEEFKREAVRLLEKRGDRSAKDVADAIGVAESQLFEWRKKYGEHAESKLNEHGDTAEQELASLRA